jgi:hypothetical protein
MMNGTKVRRLLLFTVVAVAFGSSLTAATKATDIQISLLTNISPAGCGCYVSPADNREKAYDKYLFISDAAGNAYINIEGRDTVLQEMGRKQAKDEGGYCQGKRCVYSGNGVKATVSFRETRKCPPEPTECEVTDYDVTIVVEKGGSTQRLKGKGSCGC